MYVIFPDLSIDGKPIVWLINFDLNIATSTKCCYNQENKSAVSQDPKVLAAFLDTKVGANLKKKGEKEFLIEDYERFKKDKKYTEFESPQEQFLRISKLPSVSVYDLTRTKRRPLKTSNPKSSDPIKSAERPLEAADLVHVYSNPLRQDKKTAKEVRAQSGHFSSKVNKETKKNSESKTDTNKNSSTESTKKTEAQKKQDRKSVPKKIPTNKTSNNDQIEGTAYSLFSGSAGEVATRHPKVTQKATGTPRPRKQANGVEEAKKKKAKVKKKPKSDNRTTVTSVKPDSILPAQPQTTQVEKKVPVSKPEKEIYKDIRVNTLIPDKEQGDSFYRATRAYEKDTDKAELDITTKAKKDNEERNQFKHLKTMASFKEDIARQMSIDFGGPRNQLMKSLRQIIDNNLDKIYQLNKEKYNSAERKAIADYLKAIVADVVAYSTEAQSEEIIALMRQAIEQIKSQASVVHSDPIDSILNDLLRNRIALPKVNNSIKLAVKRLVRSDNFLSEDPEKQLQRIRNETKDITNAINNDKSDEKKAKLFAQRVHKIEALVDSEIKFETTMSEQVEPLQKFKDALLTDPKCIENIQHIVNSMRVRFEENVEAYEKHTINTESLPANLATYDSYDDFYSFHKILIKANSEKVNSKRRFHFLKPDAKSFDAQAIVDELRNQLKAKNYPTAIVAKLHGDEADLFLCENWAKDIRLIVKKNLGSQKMIKKIVDYIDTKIGPINEKFIEWDKRRKEKLKQEELKKEAPEKEAKELEFEENTTTTTTSFSG